MDSTPERSLMDSEKRTKQNRRRTERIDVLPDDVLLDIFDSYVDVDLIYGKTRSGIRQWQTLVHVCRRWRSLVFQSPRRLNLQLFCTAKTPAKDGLDVWPTLPLIVRGNMASSSGTDNVIAALEQSNRVCHVVLSHIASGQFEKVMAAMQVPFPELTVLRLISDDRDKTLPTIPDSFLGGSASSLRYFYLSGIPFPGLPKLPLSADHLVTLLLFDIPHSGYISPEAIVTLLSALSALDRLTLEFRSPQPRPESQGRILPPPKRFTHPLGSLHFKGVTEYLEELVTRIDTPQLHEMQITFFNQIDFDCPRLTRFINCTPKLRALDEARVKFDDGTASVKFLSRTSSQSGVNRLEIGISCREPDWQLSSIEQVSNFSLPPLFTVEDLYVEYQYSELVWKDDASAKTVWLQALLPFTAVKNIYLSKEFAPGIAAALQVLVGPGRSTTEVLPSLENIFVEKLEAPGPFHKTIGQFIAVRQLSDHHIAISDWEKDSDTESV